MVGLRQLANSDLQGIVKDSYGFAWPCTITSPAGTQVDFDCRSNDIGLTFDPGTGTAVSGRQASVAVLTSDLHNASFQTIKGQNDPAEKPWIVEFDDIDGNSGKFKVMHTFPDRTIGMMVMILEVYL